MHESLTWRAIEYPRSAVKTTKWRNRERRTENATRQQIGDAVVDVRNEIIVQAANAFIVGRQVVLTGVGVAFLGADQIQTLLQQAVERGEKYAETEAQQTIDGLRRQLAEGTSVPRFRPRWHRCSTNCPA